MPEFIMDTDGKVADYSFYRLPDFVQGYIEAAFFTAGNNCGTLPGPGADEDGQGDDRDVGFEDLAPETLAGIISDCEIFQEENAALLAEATAYDYEMIQAGRDFWYTRNGHGTGFWDRYKEIPDEHLRDALAARCGWRSGIVPRTGTRFAEVDLYMGDDGKVYCCG